MPSFAEIGQACAAQTTANTAAAHIERARSARGLVEIDRPNISPIIYDVGVVNIGHAAGQALQEIQYV